MIDLYTWTTPNGRKASVMLEEVGLDYEVHPINIGEGEQFTPEFVAVSPNSKIPAIVDRELDEPIRQIKADVLGEAAHVARWLDAVGAREAVQKGMAIP